MNYASNSILLLTLILCFTLIPNVDAYWVNGVEIISPGHVTEIATEPSFDYSVYVSDPNASGKIILSENDFKLYRGSLITFPVIVEMNNFIHKPTLEIIYNDIKIQSVDLFSNGDFFQAIIGLNDNWESGVYKINLIHQNNILDTVSFVINRDNVVIEKTIFESVFQTIEPFISITPSVISIDKHSFGTLSVLGSINDSRKGHPIILEIISPDGTITFDSGSVTSDGAFMTSMLVDRNWIDGKYHLNAKYLDGEELSTFFTVENSLQSTLLEKAKLIGSFSVSSELSHDYTILGISGNVDTDESNMILQITKEDIIMFEDTLSLIDQSFETSTVLYDYTLNTPWAFGDYQITGLIGDKSFHSDTFTLDEQSFSVFEISSMDLFLNLGSGVEQMVDTDEIIILSGEEQQIILSGLLENYSSGDNVDIHLVGPNGVDTVSSIYASSSGEYYMPIIIDDSWSSGSYTAYVTYRDFIDEPSIFEVINNTILVDDSLLAEETSEIILQELKNYSITLDTLHSADSVHYVTAMNSYSGKTPITISLNGELLQESTIYSSDEGLIDYYLLLDENWVSGNYVVSYIENNISIPFGTFEIFNNYIVEDIVEDVILEELIDAHLTIDQSVFKSSSHTINYLPFSGKLVDDSTKEISVSLDGDLQTVLSLDSEGSYSGVISLVDLDSGFHNISIISGNVVESAEFLITTNHYISLDGDLEIFRNSIVESGGEISIFLTESVPNFVPSEIQPVIITVEGDDSYQQFFVMPKGYGFYSQNFMIDETLGSYDVSVKYGDDTIESYNIDVLAIDPQWIKSQTSLWLNGEISDYSYFKKIVLMLDDDYTVTPNVTSPDWFFESADNWMQGLMDDDSFNDAILFLAENRLL